MGNSNTGQPISVLRVAKRAMLLALIFAACCMLNNVAAAKTTAAVTLNNGVEMPLVGCGLAGKLGVPSIKEAIRAGFR